MSAYLRLVLFFLLLSAGIMSLLYLIYVILGHRRFVPIFRVLKFKLDDLQRTEKKVGEIMGEKVGKRTKRKKNTAKAVGRPRKKTAKKS